MSLIDGTLLYHGSYAPIYDVDLNKCAKGKDFGRGFYLTEDIEQAKNFIRTSLIKAKNIGIIPQDRDYGYVTVFRYRKSIDNIPCYNFNSANKEWLWFVSMNRRTNLAESFSKRMPSELLNAEIIVGKIANDTTNPTITAYLNGLYGDIESDMAVGIAIGQLLPDRLKDQYCFLSKRAVDCLELVEVIHHEQG